MNMYVVEYYLINDALWPDICICGRKTLAPYSYQVHYTELVTKQKGTTSPLDEKS